MRVEITKAINNYLVENIITPSGGVYLFETENSAMMDFELTGDNVIVESIVHLGKEFGAEVGDKDSGALSQQTGIFTAKIRTEQGSGVYLGNQCADLITKTFKLLTLPTDLPYAVNFERPFSTSGKLTEGSEYCYMVHVPFWIWVEA